MKTILRKRGLYDDIHDIVMMIKPIKELIVKLEGRTANLGECYFSLVKLAASANKISLEHHKSFRNHCINNLNKRFSEFDFDEYLLSYFLHPGFRGNIKKIITFLFYLFILFIYLFKHRCGH